MNNLDIFEGSPPLLFPPPLKRRAGVMISVGLGLGLGLLKETEKLLQEKVDVQRQAQKDHTELLEQVKQLEAELEEHVRTMAKLEETHLSESTDLCQQIHALEKQLENNRRFLDVSIVTPGHVDLTFPLFPKDVQVLI